MKKGIFIVGVISLLLFAVFSKAVKGGRFRDIDFALTVKIQERIDTSSHLRVADVVGNVMEGSTFLASPTVSVAAVLVLTVLVSIDWKRKKIQYRGLLLPLLFAVLTLTEIYGKSVVHHPAPPFFMIKNPTTMFPKYYINEEFSYPSGHAARAVFIATILYSCFMRHASYFKRKSVVLVGGLCLVLSVGLVSMSRIYLGHHWASDILGGWLLGLSLSWLLTSVI